MSCSICKPIIQGETWRVEIESGHAEQALISMSDVMGGINLSIYPIPYKPSKFWSTEINYCPYCGEDLKPKYAKHPEVLRVIKMKEDDIESE